MKIPTETQVGELISSTLIVVDDAHASEERLMAEIAAFSELLPITLQSEKLRVELSCSERIWRLIRAVLEVKVADNEQKTLKVRLVRGVIVLGRNLLSVDREQAEKLQIRQHVFAFANYLEELNVEESVEMNTLTSVFQLVANMSMNQKRHNTEALDEVVTLFQRANEHHVWTEQVLHPAFAYVDNLFSDTDVLYLALSKGEGKPLLGVALKEFESLNIEQDLTRYGTLIVGIFTKLVLHESFLKFITTYNTPEDTLRYLKVAEAIITSRTNWEVFELTVVLSWNFELFKKTLVEVQHYFESKSTDEPKFIYGKIFSVMDVLSTLSHLEHTRKFLLSYHGVELLVSLLGTIHKNVKPRSKLKDQENTKDKVADIKNFPHIKSMVIETLTSLVHDNFEVQELIRETHGLPVILSCCIIDDNEPFIKERAIVCLRFLLKDNQKNQDFVAKLEAKEVIPNEDLDDIGFEVEIIDGKVQMKKKPKVEEIN